jgi:hypothetical protein
VEVTAYELFLKVREEERLGHRKPGVDEETCPICMCELYEGVDDPKNEDMIKEMHEKQMK